jgi:hypothetical protein
MDASSSITYHALVFVLPHLPSSKFFPALLELPKCENCAVIGYSAAISGKLLTDVSGKPVCPIFKEQDGASRLSVTSVRNCHY